MGTISGSSVAEIEAPIEDVWKVVEDVLIAPEWQGGMKDMVELERDSDGHVVLVEAHADAKVRTLKSTVRFTYDGPTRLSWRQEKGELKSVVGTWHLEDLGDGRTRATYELAVDLGRMLGMVIRGPMVDMLRGQLVSARADELKKKAEAG
jgi:carbon monoxide dehydrogenase subunit G